MGDTCIALDVGDVLVDIKTKETGLLVRRFNLFSHTNNPIYPPIYGWDILWSGRKKNNVSEGCQAFTEESLINMIKAGAMVLHKLEGN